MSAEYRLLTYAGPDGPCAGVCINETVYDAADVAGSSQYGAVLPILADWSALDDVFAAFAEAGGGRGLAGRPLTSLVLLPPVLYPGEIWAAGANYNDHISEMAEDTEYKAVNAKTLSGGRAWHFAKTSRSALVGHDSINPLPDYSKMVDWEIELAVVIGKTASKVKAADAMGHVAGYAIANDLSARDYVARPGIAADSPFRFDWLSHKGFDGSCPLGPWITPARYVKDPHALDMKLWVDDTLMQDSNTRHMIFDISEQIEEISARTTMHPGDIILTGTPSGVGFSRNIFLKSGQKLKLEIGGLGELRHSFL